LVIISPESLQERSDIRWGTGKKSKKICRANGRIRESFHLQGRKAGEASAITLAWPFRDSSLLVLDEKRGRKVASALGLRITGTEGLLTDAAAAGLVDFEDVFLRLSQAAFRLSSQVVETLRQSVNKHRPSAES
jgi:predicted nucleic acid-binding protein